MRKLLWIVVCLLAFASPSWGAVAHDHTGTSGTTTGTISSWTVAVTCSANATIVFYNNTSSAVTIGSVTDGASLVATKVTSVVDSANSRYLDVWEVFSASAQTAHNFTVTLAASATQSSASGTIYDTYTGTATSNMIEAFNSAPMTSQATFSVNVTTVTANALVLAYASSSTGFNAGTGYTTGTLTSGYGSGGSGESEFKNAVTASPGSVAATMAPFISASGAILAVALKDANAPTTSNHLLTLLGVGT